MHGADTVSLFQLGVALNAVFSQYIYFYERNIKELEYSADAVLHDIQYSFEKLDDNSINNNRDIIDNCTKQYASSTLILKNIYFDGIIPELFSIFGIILALISSILLYAFSCYSADSVSDAWAFIGLCMCVLPISIALIIYIEALKIGISIKQLRNCLSDVAKINISQF